MLIGFELPFLLTFVLALLFGAGLAMAFYFGVLIPAQRREANLLSQIILTLGLGLIIQGLVAYFGGTQPQDFPFPLSDLTTYHMGTVVISQLSLGTIAVGLLVWFASRAARLYDASTGEELGKPFQHNDLIKKV